MGAGESHHQQHPNSHAHAHPHSQRRPAPGHTAGPPRAPYPQQTPHQGQPGVYQGQGQGQGQGGARNLGPSPSIQFREKYGFIPDQFTSLQQVGLSRATNSAPFPRSQMVC